MNPNTAIIAHNISKQYRLGEVGTGTISHDLNRFWAKLRGKEDPFLKIGESNDRSTKGDSDYVWSLKDINFEIEKGDAVGIIGRNGAGKSTLLKLLSRVTKPTTGHFEVQGRIASLLEVGTGFNPEMTGRENIFLNGAILGMRRHEIKRKFDEIVDFAGVERYIDTPVKRYSSGMYVRLAFAVAAHLESEILIVDEVLAVGDAEFQKKCLGKMGDVSKGEGRTVLFVSHNMAAVQNLCEKGILLNKGKTSMIGNMDEVINSYLDDFSVTESGYYSEKGYVRKLTISQIEDWLEIECHYTFQGQEAKPCLGFVVLDMDGKILFANNPKISSPLINLGIKREGVLKCKIGEPKLLDGDYLLNFYFGDGITDFEIVKERIKFSVTNMYKFDHPILRSNSGPIVSKVDWYE